MPIPALDGARWQPVRYTALTATPNVGWTLEDPVLFLESSFDIATREHRLHHTLTMPTGNVATYSWHVICAGLWHGCRQFFRYDSIDRSSQEVLTGSCA